ncbi:3293_t:CDS:2, partial [Racocetra persica]
MASSKTISAKVALFLDFEMAIVSVATESDKTSMRVSNNAFQEGPGFMSCSPSSIGSSSASSGSSTRKHEQSSRPQSSQVGGSQLKVSSPGSLFKQAQEAQISWTACSNLSILYARKGGGRVLVLALASLGRIGVPFSPYFGRRRIGGGGRGVVLLGQVSIIGGDFFHDFLAEVSIEFIVGFSQLLGQQGFDL